MATYKHVTISISVEVYERVNRLCPRKKWGENKKAQFWTDIFLKGLESPDFLKKELEMKSSEIKILKLMLFSDKEKKEKQQDIESTIESIARVAATLNSAAPKPVVQSQPSKEEPAPVSPGPEKSSVH